MPGQKKRQRQQSSPSSQQKPVNKHTKQHSDIAHSNSSLLTGPEPDKTGVVHKDTTQLPVTSIDMLQSVDTPSSTQPTNLHRMEDTATPTVLPSDNIAEDVLAKISTGMDEKEMNFAKLIATMHEEYFKKFKVENDKVHECLQIEIENHQQTRAMHAALVETNTRLEARVISLENKVVTLNNKLLDNDIYSKRKNLIISGLKEVHGETNLTLRSWFATLADRLKTPAPTIMAIHRLKSNNKARPRDVIIQFDDYMTKRAFFKARFDIKKSHADYHNIYISEHFPREVTEQRKVLQAVATEARMLYPDIKERISVFENTLFINNARYKMETLHTLPEALHPMIEGCKFDDSSYIFFTKRSKLSNHFESPFILNGVRYNCGEQYFMAMKARTFEDSESPQRIMQTTSPVAQKAIGRTIKGFNATKWYRESPDILYPGLLARFEQNEHCKAALLGTGRRRLGEATTEAPWGTGKRLNDLDALDQSKWSDMNIIGDLLERIRNTLGSTMSTY